MFNKILVVCTGNICRSPMGEILLRTALGGGARQVLSAGTGALTGHPADPMACELMQERGLDLSPHRAQQATLPLLSSMDLILTLDHTHSDWLLRQYPQLRGRVHKLMKWDGDVDVPDPYRLPRAAFEEALAMIEAGVGSWVRKM